VFFFIFQKNTSMKKIALFLFVLGLTVAIACRRNTCRQLGQVRNDCICPAIAAPVCGCDGNTYGNACEAECNGVTEYVDGLCN
jgi:hypothetical protein